MPVSFWRPFRPDIFLSGRNFIPHMKKISLLFALTLSVLVVGCSTTEPATTASERDTSTTTSETSAPSDTAASTPSLAEAARDWHHSAPDRSSTPGLSTRQAYQTYLDDQAPRDTIVVAIIDSGIDVGHEDLSAQRWTNDDEVPGNGTDDDNNGYVDDVHGWNFIGGPDGTNVNEDTYELTRLYVKLRERFAGVDTSDLAPEAQEDFQRYQKLKEKLQQKRQEAQQRLKKVAQMRDGIDMSERLLKQHLGTDTITQEALDSLSTTDENVLQARNFLSSIFQQNLTPEDVRDYHDHLQRQVEYNYNPDFNPRSIVGDDYSDKTERQYGNNDVTGPDAAHGTHVAGIMAATRNNDLGIDGIARGIQVMSVRAVPNGDERDKDVANAIHYAVNNGADVINMSFGKAYSPYKSVVDDAVQRADSAGVLMVHAAGNDGANVDSTDNYPTPQYEDGGEAQLWIEVGASSWKGGKHLAAPFSNYGSETVDVFAPGHSIFSTAPQNGYDRSDGTSMAAPMVSGLAALLMAHYPQLTPEEVHTIILESATTYEDQEVVRPGNSGLVRFGTLSKTGAIVNARAALQRAEEMTTEN